MNKILLRFDDLSEYTCFETWQNIEIILTQNNLKPIIAIIPDNKDPNVTKNGIGNKQVSTEEFWSTVRRWQSDYEWEIAAHGLTHKLSVTNNNLLKFSYLSEFADFTENETKALVEASLNIFKHNGVMVRTWVSPAHGFDATVLKCLKDAGIRFVSDGMYYSVVHQKNGLVFVPQQVWSLRAFYPFKVTTICLHHLRWTESQLRIFENFIIKNRYRISSLEEIKNSVRDINLFDTFFNDLLCNLLLYKRRRKKEIQGIQ